jgi:hypothetical protein
MSLLIVQAGLSDAARALQAALCYIYSMLKEDCHEACLSTCELPTRQPLQHHSSCSCVLHATMLLCCKLFC